MLPVAAEHQRLPPVQASVCRPMVHSLSRRRKSGMTSGRLRRWPSFFEVLRLYLTHFAGAGRRPARRMAKVEAETILGLETRLTEQLDWPGVERGRAAQDTAPARGPVGRPRRVHQAIRQQRYITMRLDCPAPGIALVGTYAAGPQVTIGSMIPWTSTARRRGPGRQREPVRATGLGHA